ncbi:MAG: DUF5005 domain-containing protein [Prevotella sp.]|nr:DUF5005 domain-containing protein [Prevotella sp.]
MISSTNNSSSLIKMTGRLLSVLFLVCSLVSCDDYDIVSTANDPDMQEAPEKGNVQPPALQAEWQLQLVPDVGRQAEGTYIYKDLKYNSLFQRAMGWNGGEGAVSVLLPDGNIAWLFNESYTGVVNPDDNSRLSGNQPRNSLLIQRSTGGTLGETSADLVYIGDYVNVTDPEGKAYMYGKTFLRHPQGGKSQSQIDQGQIDNNNVYHVASATVIDGKLNVLWRATNPAGTLNQGLALSVHSLSGSMPTAYFTPELPDYLPAAGQYMYQESINHEFSTNRTIYGINLYEAADGYTYLYALNAGDLLVARASGHNLNAAWEYYIRDTSGQYQWQTTEPTVDEMLRSVVMENGYQCQLPQVFKDGDMYYLLSQSTTSATTVYLYTAPTPYGPFSNQKMLFNLPARLDKLGLQTVESISQVRVHPELSRQGELVVSVATQPANANDNYNYPGSAEYQRPHFYRIYNWKKVYEAQ